MGNKPTQKLTCTDEERDKTIRLVSQLVRWANTKDDYQSDLNNLTDADFLTKQEVIQLETMAQRGTTGTVVWQGKDKSTPELLVKVSKRAFLEALCGLPGRDDVRTHLNGYLRVQKARDTDQKTFLGILIDHRPLDNDGKTREPPDFTLKLWSRKVAINETELTQRWNEKRKEWIEKGWLSERRGMNTQSETDHDLQDGESAPFSEPPTIDFSLTPPSSGTLVFREPMPNPQPPLHLNGQQMEELQLVLQKVFYRPKMFAMMLKLQLDENVENLASDGTHSERIFDVIQAFNADDRAEDLLRGALMAKPNSPDLQELATKWLKI